MDNTIDVNKELYAMARDGVRARVLKRRAALATEALNNALDICDQARKLGVRTTLECLSDTEYVAYVRMRIGVHDRHLMCYFEREDN